MQIQLDVGFDQLVKIAKSLSPKQWSRLKRAVEREDTPEEQRDLEAFLLSAPVLNDEQLKAIEEAREHINQWRKQ